MDYPIRLSWRILSWQNIVGFQPNKLGLVLSLLLLFNAFLKYKLAFIWHIHEAIFQESNILKCTKLAILIQIPRNQTQFSKAKDLLERGVKFGDLN